ncbi:Nin one binding Zn-ribbon like-domain-containing protein [Lipomyces japonicus]|uniref:Nin one binding Zn-ribbon like-domain-containing protein n=1 Tax=Lipomyces japonicus TaxID=56871 RepID=UPI0034CE690C
MSSNTSQVQCLILDAGPLIVNSYSALSQFAQEFVTTASVYNEIRDERARQNLLLWGDKLKVRQPTTEFIQIVSDFAKKTGDYSVLSSTDLHIIALAYELEVERNNGDWRLRKAPGQTRINGPNPSKPLENAVTNEDSHDVTEVTKKVDGLNLTKDEKENLVPQSNQNAASNLENADLKQNLNDNQVLSSSDATDGWSTVKVKRRPGGKPIISKKHAQKPAKGNENSSLNSEAPLVGEVAEEKDDNIHVIETPKKESSDKAEVASINETDESEKIEDNDEEDSDDEEGWITPDTLQQQQILDGTLEAHPNAIGSGAEQGRILKVGMASGDFAMQNVAMQIGLNVINPSSGFQIRKIRSWMLRCHACFFLTPPPTGNTPRQFCARCGGATLLRCTVTTSAQTGQLQIHLKKNFKWSHRGDRYSLPNPQSKLGRKTGGEGVEQVLLREDQKEYLKAVKDDAWRKRHNEKMLEAWIGGGGVDSAGSPFASGSYKREASKAGVKVGKGRFVNERRRTKK